MFDCDQIILSQRNVGKVYMQWLKISCHQTDVARGVRPTNPFPLHACISKSCPRTKLCYREGHSRRYQDQG